MTLAFDAKVYDLQQNDKKILTETEFVLNSSTTTKIVPGLIDFGSGRHS